MADYIFLGGNADAKYSLEITEQEGISLLKVRADFPEAVTPECFTLRWQIPAVDIYSVFSPNSGWNTGLGVSWGMKTTQSRMAVNQPVHQMISLSGENRLCIAVSDPKTPLEIRTGIEEETALFRCEVAFFTFPTAPMSHYEAVIRLDRRALPYWDSLYAVNRWWEEEYGFVSSPAPDAARRPVNSLWYSFHQDLDKDEIVRQCALSRPYGMETAIIDDGWQTDDTNRGYAYCGDWEVAPKKMGDMAELCRRVHETGTGLMVWFSVPFIGGKSKAIEKFRDVLLDESYWPDSDSYCLDPRYPRVREYLVDIYTRAVRDWGLDGLKLDFIDSFVLRGRSLQPAPGMDFASLEDALEALLRETRDALRAIRPEVLIEFRQSYTGPVIRTYGNMLRVGDCPNDPFCNRVGILNMRLTCGSTPIHSDMLMWNYEDTVESAALQLCCILYGVPQISVLIDRLTPEHGKMLRFWLNYWNENREVLLDGKLTALNPEANYSQAASTLGDRSVVTVYTDRVVEIHQPSVDIINCSERDTLLLKGGEGRTCTLFNCMGEQTGCLRLTTPLQEIAVPKAGLVQIR